MLKHKTRHLEPAKMVDSAAEILHMDIAGIETKLDY
jgi:hypothetical protein